MIGILCTLLSLLSIVGIKPQCYSDTVIFQENIPVAAVVTVEDIDKVINSIDEDTLYIYYINSLVSSGVALTEQQMVRVLQIAGWDSRYIPEALSVSHGESRWSPYAIGDSGTSYGLFQIKSQSLGWDGWWLYFGFDVSRYYEPVYNAKLAWLIFNYERQRGYVRWSNWSVKPTIFSASN